MLLVSDVHSHFACRKSKAWTSCFTRMILPTG
jgi:hypothetical protein